MRKGLNSRLKMAGLFLALITGLPVALLQINCDEVPVPSAQAPMRTHVVQTGEFLRSIAGQYDVSWEAILLTNETYLQAQYEETCGSKPESYTNNARRRGTFCNNRYHRPYGNTLKPGWKLNIPASTAPAAINAVVEAAHGDRIALVIDDTGSMNEDRQRVSAFYLAAIQQYSKRLTGVWLYADGVVRKYEGGNVRFSTSGNVENTFGALREAAATSPDTIILVTDEPGDDWDWSEVNRLPPVLAHCLKDGGTFLCEENLRRVAQETNGRYTAGIK